VTDDMTVVPLSASLPQKISADTDRLSQIRSTENYCVNPKMVKILEAR